MTHCSGSCFAGTKTNTRGVVRVSGRRMDTAIANAMRFGADLRILKGSEGAAFEHASIIMLFSCIHVLEVHKRTQRVSINTQIGDPLMWEPNISSYRVSEIMNPVHRVVLRYAEALNGCGRTW